MEVCESIEFSTFSPIRTPINSYSELRASLTPHEHNDFLVGLSSILQQFFIPKEKLKSDGYCDINHDNHPYFFQPLFTGEVDLKNVDAFLVNSEEISWWEQCEIKQCEIHFFDDSIAVLKFDFRFINPDRIQLEMLKNGQFDRDISGLVKHIYTLCIYPYLSKIYTVLNDIALSNIVKPKEFFIFNDIDFSAYEPKYDTVLWTGRMAYMPKGASELLTNSLHGWVGLADGDEADSFVLGSGNILINESIQENDWGRILVVCQSYNAILYLLNLKLKEKYAEISGGKKAKKHKQPNLTGTLGHTVRALEHIEFCQLEFKDAMIGTQAKRALIMELLSKAWKLPELEKLTIHRANLIKSRIDTILKEQQVKINRSVEYLLSAIGCLAIVDLTITLVSTSDNLKPDNIPGLFDLFKAIPHDGSAWVSIFLVVIISLYLYKIRNS